MRSSDQRVRASGPGLAPHLGDALDDLGVETRPAIHLIHRFQICECFHAVPAVHFEAADVLELGFQILDEPPG
jgi:hypothetical protein